MASFIVDWQQSVEYVPTDIDANMEANRFRFDPLHICTKDGPNFEMDARIILQIGDDSTIVKDFGSFSVFVEKRLNILIKNFFTYKERGYIASNHFGFQEELVRLLQKEIIKYDVKIQKFMMVSTSGLSHSNIQDEGEGAKGNDKRNMTGVDKTKIPENPYRKALASMYIENCMGKEDYYMIKNAVDGNENDRSLDYYVGAERMINNAIQVFRTLNQEDLHGAGLGFSKMLFYVSYEIERLSVFENKV